MSPRGALCPGSQLTGHHCGDAEVGDPYTPTSVICPPCRSDDSFTNIHLNPVRFQHRLCPPTHVTTQVSGEPFTGSRWSSSRPPQHEDAVPQPCGELVESLSGECQAEHNTGLHVSDSNPPKRHHILTDHFPYMFRRPSVSFAPSWSGNPRAQG